MGVMLAGRGFVVDAPKAKALANDLPDAVGSVFVQSAMVRTCSTKAVGRG